MRAALLAPTIRDGRAAARRAQTKSPELKVVIVTPRAWRRARGHVIDFILIAPGLTKAQQKCLIDEVRPAMHTGLNGGMVF